MRTGSRFGRTQTWWKKEYFRVNPTMSSQQAGYGMKVKKEQQAADNTQYNQLVAQFTLGHTASQGSVANITVTNAAEQQKITTLQQQLANSAAQVMYMPPVEQFMMQMMPMQHHHQQRRGHGGRNRGRGSGRGQNKNG